MDKIKAVSILTAFLFAYKKLMRNSHELLLVTVVSACDTKDTKQEEEQVKEVKIKRKCH